VKAPVCYETRLSDSGIAASGRLDAHRDGKHYVMRAHEKLTVFLELEAVIRKKKGIDIVCRGLAESHPC